MKSSIGDEMKKYNPKTVRSKRRLSVLLVLCGIAVALIIGRLFSLQVLDSSYRQKMLEYTRKTVEIAPTRGQITDREGYALAYDEQAFVLYLYPDELKDEDPKNQKDIQEILQVDDEQMTTWMNQTGDVHADIPLTADQVKKLEKIQTRGLSIMTQSQRRYPDGGMSSAIVGFTNDEHVGTMGVEAYYDEELRGTPGKTQLFSYGGGIPVPFEQQTVYPAKEGNRLALTLDAAIQDIVMKQGNIGYETFTPKKMSIIVMNPNTGEILGLGDFPSLDASNPRAGRTEEEKKELETLSDEKKLDKYYDMWRSFSYQDVYEPGSVFKMITAAAAYEEGTARDDSIYHCDGYVTDIPGVTIRCWSYYEPHGDLTLTEAVDESCNPAFIQMIRELGKEKSKKYIDAFGFGVRTGVGLPSEEIGLIPPGPEEIDEATFATNSYGHGIAVTPLQMVTAISALANGGTLYQPQIIHTITEADGTVVQSFEPKPVRQVISEATSKKMLELFEHGAIHGTADGAHIPGYRIGGKTGTSVKFVDGAYSSEIVVGSYVGLFPADRPEIAVMVVVDEPQESTSGNTSAAPIAKLILQEYIRIRGIQPTEPIEELPRSAPGDSPTTYPLEINDDAVEETDIVVEEVSEEETAEDVSEEEVEEQDDVTDGDDQP